MTFKVGYWVVIDNHGDIWTTKIKEIKDEIVVKPETSVYVDTKKWFHVSRIRKATKGEIELIR